MSGLDEIFREFALTFAGRLEPVDGDIAFPEELARNLLDGTHQSLKAVDAYLSSLYRRRDHIDETSWHKTVLWGGAYVGEVIRWETNGAMRWVDYNEYMPQHPTLKPLIPERTTATCAFLVADDGFMSMPLNKIARYVDEGEEHSTHFFAHCDISRSKKRAG